MVCLECDGEGWIECEGIHPNRKGSTSQMEQPDWWKEKCETCNGKGRIDDEDDDEGDLRPDGGTR